MAPPILFPYPLNLTAEELAKITFEAISSPSFNILKLKMVTFAKTRREFISNDSPLPLKIVLDAS